jgi:hypothetical protein
LPTPAALGTALEAASARTGVQEVLPSPREWSRALGKGEFWVGVGVDGIDIYVY